MERPALRELDAIMQAVYELRDQERRLDEAKAVVTASVEALSGVVDWASRLDAAVYAYWHAPEINAMQLARITVGKASAAAMLKRAGAVSIGIDCDRCGEDLTIYSRTMMPRVLKASDGRTQPWPEGYRILCEECQEAIHEERREKSHQRRREEDERLRILAGLSYADYLATPDWQAELIAVMEHILYIHQRLECEVCPEREGLWFVHRELDLLGRREEVSLLCDTCAGALGGVGKLAHPRTPANRAHRKLLDPVERAFRDERGWDDPL